MRLVGSGGRLTDGCLVPAGSPRAESGHSGVRLAVPAVSGTKLGLGYCVAMGEKQGQRSCGDQVAAGSWPALSLAGRSCGLSGARKGLVVWRDGPESGRGSAAGAQFRNQATRRSRLYRMAQAAAL